MPNTLENYNPIFYAQEALIQLEKSLGIAGRIHRGYSEERQSFDRGEFINIRKPSSFTVKDAPDTAQDLATESVSIQLNYWREVKFKLTDKELSFTSERIINDHIRPAAYVLADDVDQKLAALYTDIPWETLSVLAATTVANATDAYKILFDNAVPMNDLHFMVGSGLQQSFQNLAAFTQWQGSGSTGEQSQLRGTIGTRFGMEFFANQNTPSHTSSAAGDSAGAVNNGAGYAKGVTTINVDALSISGVYKKGDSFVIAGNTQRYALTADATMDGAGAGALVFTPPLAAAVADNAVVTFSNQGAAGGVKVQNLVFNRNAFAVAFAPLSEMGSELGAKIATVRDPVTGLAVRSRMYYVGDSSAVHVCLDILYGVKTLNPNLALRAYHA